MKTVFTPIVASAEHLADGERLVCTYGMVKTKKRMTFTADIGELGDGKIYVCHDYMKNDASWIEITKNTVGAYAYYSYANPQKQNLLGGEIEHGLTVSGFINVTVDYRPKEKLATLLINTSSGGFKTTIKNWCGHQGNVFAFFEGTEGDNCKLSWASDDYARKIWVIGDSYIGFGHGARWPYYLFRDGFTEMLILGYPGMSSETGIKEFKRVIDYGAPEYVFWTLGMNNPDPDENTISEGYLASVTEFLKICDERGITPILSTIPNVPARPSRKKNEFVRTSGYRYVDFSRAVGSDKAPAWYPEMLSADNVHPASRGAEALYSQALVDFPEIMSTNEI